MNTLPITVAMLVKNAERCLKEVLTALTDFDEVLLLDNGSTDKTLEIAAQFANVVVHHHEFDGFGEMKNHVADLAKHDWIFSVDSDEVVSPELLDAIKTADFRQPENIFQISRANYYRRRLIKGCGWSSDILARIYNRTFTRFSDRAVDEALLLPENANIQLLSGSLHHYSYDDLDSILKKIQLYSTLFVQQFAYTRRVNHTDAMLHGTAAFIKSYVIKRGWRDGTDGLTISVLQGVSAFCQYAKLREANENLPVSLIITTYNRADALQKVLYSVLKQRVLPREILIADDGSGAETMNVVAEFAKICSIPVRHIWQEDDGFRAAQSRNRALAAAQYDYIVLIDGDMILHEEFIADHIAAAQKGCIIQGSRVLLSPDKTEDLLIEPTLSEPLHWYSKGGQKRLSAIRCAFLSKQIWQRKSQSLKAIKSCNLSFFRADALAVNGFNNEFVGWGREDSEFFARLYHHGIWRRNLKFAAVAYHLWHHQAERDALPQNEMLLRRTLDEKLTWCENGVNHFLE